ncbi:MAG: leucyl aminopeptidase family protein [Gammaproteobacteria bacterium]|nr:leucyl aminopeptidase family protein [Gammaproteobacteria bacterium]
MIGVSPKQVKQRTGDGLLPPASRFRVVQIAGRPTRAALRAVDHLVVISPARVPDSLWREFAGLTSLRAVVKRLGKSGPGRALRGGLAAGPAVTLGLMPAAARGSKGALPSSFRLLRFAGDVVADALAHEPRSLGILVHGFPTDDAARVTRALLLAIGARAFGLPSFQKGAKPPALKSVHVFGHAQHIDLERTLVELDGANLVRWLTALPANKLSAGAYRELLERLAREQGWSFSWLDETELARRNAGAFLAVSQGNATRDLAGIAHLCYRPKGGPRSGAGPDVALVGKGIIFDTGGTNLKPSVHMLDMHMDMSGSAVALALLRSLTALRAPLAVDCWLAITENRTGPTAYKQRDVVAASNGVTIEIVHTDAEGRMVLADTLALAATRKPALILDFATLTGACVHALSERYSGVFTNRETLNDLLVRAGRDCGERVWPFPNDEDFDDDLKSKVADVAQCATAGEADHILAARFLQRFVPDAIPWIHMDLGAVMRKDGLGQMPGGFTGFGLRYALALLLDHAVDLRRLAG